MKNNMEGFEAQEYRDNLSHKLHEIRNSDPENKEKARAEARGFLEAQKKTEAYREADNVHWRENWNMSRYEETVGMKRHTVDDLVEIINAGYDKIGDEKGVLKRKSPELLKSIVSEGVEAIDRIKDSGFMLSSSGLNYSRSTPLFSKKFNLAYDAKDSDYEKFYFAKEYFGEDLKKIALLISEINLSGTQGGHHEDILFDLVGSICDCCDDSDCPDLMVPCSHALVDTLKERRKKFFKDHKKEIQERITKKKEEEEKNKQEKLKKIKKAELRRFDPGI